jgi:hypothetical protein
MKEAKIEALREELKSIHFANVLYWTNSAEPNSAARAEYQRRQDRLGEIKVELYAFIVSQASVTGKSRRSRRPSTRSAHLAA